MRASRPKSDGSGAHKAPGCTVIRFDFLVFLKKITGIGGWKEVNGPDSQVGLDYWYRAGRHESYINLDQGHMSVSVDQEIAFEGSADEAQCKEA
jgi:hypothetical protein